MCDHTFCYTPAVEYLRAMVNDGVLGEIQYFDSVRINLGLVRYDTDVLWDLAPHDLSILDYVLPEGLRPVAVAAHGADPLATGQACIAYLYLHLPGGAIAHVHVNWLSPVKVRMTLIGGEKKMIVWNDLVNDEKIRVYDRGVKVTSPEGVNALKVGYRSGDMWAPKVEATEALKLELGYFVNCINKNEVPINDGLAGLRVVRMLEAGAESLSKKKEMVLA